MGVCVCGFYNVWVCVCVDFIMCGCVCVCVGFVKWGCLGNLCTCIYCVFALFHLCTFIFIFYSCKEYCHRVKTHLQ